MTYARARLWLGISGVGTWVLLSLAGILGQWGSLWRSPFPTEWGAAGDLALWLLGFTLIQGPFDWLGGWYLPKRYGREPISFLAWGRGVLAMGLLWWLGAVSMFWVGQRAGLFGALLAMAGWMLLLTLAQEWVARGVGGLVTAGTEGNAVLLAAKDPGFSGGWAGIGPTLRLLTPAHWPQTARQVQTVRRQALLESGARKRGLAVAMAFNLAGVGVAYALTPGAGFGHTGEYLHLVFGFTLWSFLGLLVLPSLTRPAVFLADRIASQRGVAWQESARLLDRLQDDEPARTPWVERIFHPVPSLKARLSAGKPVSWGAWQAARLALYLGAAMPGLLARSVHCNAGRPDLWVFYPAD